MISARMWAPRGAREFEFFEDEYARALAAYKAVAVLVQGATGVGRVVVAGGKRLHGGEPADAQGCDGGLGAAGDHGVGVAALDDAKGIADGVGRRGAGGRGGLVGAARAKADGDVSSGQVDDGPGDEERRNLARTAGQHVGVFALDDVEAADSRADMDANAVTVRLVDLEAGAGPWPPARRQSQNG